jgi:hypothetical protein
VREGRGRNEKLASSKGPARMGIRHRDRGTAFPSKGFSFYFLSYLNMYPMYRYNIYLCVLDKKETLCRLKINHASGSETCFYS